MTCLSVGLTKDSLSVRRSDHETGHVDMEPCRDLRIMKRPVENRTELLSTNNMLPGLCYVAVILLNTHHGGS
jgi:hypothetical protein